ncbi:cytochrome c oxidase subunit V [Kockovaella imperatae]|uniref:Cytochrome c oxidase subunit V n=1 Tax=Kockovaella imperatae TaxID=4999 RepID=A0A1Y1U943_9TREE|nr:cytochrome c oxidase subunit V [Kockovaella imperatae]ORX34548.1 cytochrome c oxidase subunit V [Kockovaella imperatae]
MSPLSSSLRQAVATASRASTRTTLRSYASPAISVTSTRSNTSAPSLANIEATWTHLPKEERYEVYKQLHDLQKKDWKELSRDEKRAAYYIAFGPHGPRKPIHGDGYGMQVALGTAGIVGASVLAFLTVRHFGQPLPETMTKEYQEQSNEYMRSQNMNPISGVSSEGYKGKGMVQS